MNVVRISSCQVANSCSISGNNPAALRIALSFSKPIRNLAAISCMSSSLIISSTRLISLKNPSLKKSFMNFAMAASRKTSFRLSRKSFVASSAERPSSIPRCIASAAAFTTVVTCVMACSRAVVNSSAEILPSANALSNACLAISAAAGKSWKKI